MATIYRAKLRDPAPPRVLASGAPALWRAGPGEPIELSLLTTTTSGGGLLYRVVLDPSDAEALVYLMKERRRG